MSCHLLSSVSYSSPVDGLLSQWMGGGRMFCHLQSSVSHATPVEKLPSNVIKGGGCLAISRYLFSILLLCTVSFAKDGMGGGGEREGG